LAVGRYLASTAGTGRGQRRSALLTELRCGRVLVLAA
jgi:hypothetical protein